MLALALVAAASGHAQAGRLGKDACRALRVRLADMLALGVRDDMERGPDWAKANLTQERLGEIKRLIEVEGRLEFQCGMSRAKVVATKPVRAPVMPEMPTQKPDAVTNATETTQATAPAKKSATAPVAGKPTATIPVTTKAAAPTTAPTKSASIKAVSIKPGVELPDFANGLRPSDKPSGQTGVKPVKPAATATTTGATGASGTHTAASAPAKPEPAKTTRSRRRSSSAYVSPLDVNPGFLTRYGSAD